MTPQQAFRKAMADEGVLGTPLEQIALKTAGFESGWDADAVSNRGARGLMQVMPATFSEIADEGWDINDPYANARAGIRYLKQGWDKSGGDPALTGAYYYGGPGGMQAAMNGEARYDPVNPNFPSTIEYGQRLANAVGQGQKPMNTNFPNALGTMSASAPEIKRQLEGMVPDPEVSPELIQGITKKRQKSMSMLPLALGALLSGDKQIQALGSNLYQRGMDARELMAIGDEGYINPTEGTFLRSPVGEERRNLALAQAAIGSQDNRLKVLSNYGLQQQLMQMENMFKAAGLEQKWASFINSPDGQRAIKEGRLPNPTEIANSQPSDNVATPNMPAQDMGVPSPQALADNAPMAPAPQNGRPQTQAPAAVTPAEYKQNLESEIKEMQIMGRQEWNKANQERIARTGSSPYVNYEDYEKNARLYKEAAEKKLAELSADVSALDENMLRFDEFVRINKDYGTGGLWPAVFGENPLFYGDEGDRLISLSSEMKSSAVPQGQGAVSDAERRLFGASVPNMEYDYKTNEAIRDMMALRRQFKRAYLSAMREYASSNMGDLKGASEEIAKRLEQEFLKSAGPRYEQLRKLLPPGAFGEAPAAASEANRFKVK